MQQQAQGPTQQERVSARRLGEIGIKSLFHDFTTTPPPRIEQAWSEQQQLDQSIVNMILSPRETASAAMEQIANRYQAAMKMRNPYDQSAALAALFNDVGQAALGMGYGAASLVRPIRAVAQTVGKNAFTGPRRAAEGRSSGPWAAEEVFSPAAR